MLQSEVGKIHFFSPRILIFRQYFDIQDTVLSVDTSGLDFVRPGLECRGLTSGVGLAVAPRLSIFFVAYVLPLLLHRILFLMFPCTRIGDNT